MPPQPPVEIDFRQTHVHFLEDLPKGPTNDISVRVKKRRIYSTTESLIMPTNHVKARMHLFDDYDDG
jgi:hypothetical protein